MKGYNLIAVFGEANGKVLMCRRRKPPFQGLLNLVGGKIEPGETGLSAAYRELFEETGIGRAEIDLTQSAVFTYLQDDYYLEIYTGRLKRPVEVYGEENELAWISLNENFFDTRRFAGEGLVGHILKLSAYQKGQLFQGS